MIIGNDISQFQGSINWDTYKQNSNFVIIRSTYGNGYYDSWFAHNRDEARRVNLPRGFYHYCYPEYNSPQDEAAWFCKALYDLKEGESLYLDFEESYSGDIVAWCKAFLDYVSQNFNGIKPLIYLNQSYMNLDWSPVISAGYGLWLASYQADGVGNTGKWPFMAMQQTSSSQQVPGIVGNVDRDVFFGDINAFYAYGYHQPPAQQPVTPPAPVTPVVAQPEATVATSTPITVITDQPIVSIPVQTEAVSQPKPVVTTPQATPKKSFWQTVLDLIKKYL